MAKLARQPPDPGPYRRLSVTFFRRKTEVVARALIGKLIVHGERAGIIVECEAYLGREDRASHARFGETKRSRVMFGPGGIAYLIQKKRSPVGIFKTSPPIGYCSGEGAFGMAEKLTLQD